MVIYAFHAGRQVSACHIFRLGGHKPGKPGILRDFSEHGKLGEFSWNSVQPQGKIVTNKVFLVRHSNIGVKHLLTGSTGSLGTETRSECGGDLLYC